MSKNLVTVDIVISKDGTTSTEVSGVKGKGCTKVSEVVEVALGTVSKRTAKPEMDLPPDIGDRTTIRGR